MDGRSVQKRGVRSEASRSDRQQSRRNPRHFLLLSRNHTHQSAVRLYHHDHGDFSPESASGGDGIEGKIRQVSDELGKITTQIVRTMQEM